MTIIKFDGIKIIQYYGMRDYAQFKISQKAHFQKYKTSLGSISMQKNVNAFHA